MANFAAFVEHSNAKKFSTSGGGGFAPVTPLDSAGGSALRPPLYIKHGASQLYLGVCGAPALEPALLLCLSEPPCYGQY